MISFQNSADHSSYLWTPFKQITLIKLTEQSAVFIHSQKQLPMNDFIDEDQQQGTQVCLHCQASRQI